MTFLEQLRNLDRSDVGRWPLLFRGLLIGLIFIIVTLLLSYYFVWNKQRPDLLQAEQTELDLKDKFEQRQKKAANFEAYKTQLAEMKKTFGLMLGQLPGKIELPNLLEDISQTGLALGLDQKLFTRSEEIRRDFYAELPIHIRFIGTYHQLGGFVSGIAALPRIVTLHDVDIRPEKSGTDMLTLDVTAKTYRYLEEDEGGTKPAAGK